MCLVDGLNTEMSLDCIHTQLIPHRELLNFDFKNQSPTAP